MPFTDPTWVEIRGLGVDWEAIRTPLADFGSHVLQTGGQQTKTLVNTFLWPTIVRFKCFLDLQLDQENVRQFSTEELLGVLSVRFAWLATNREELISTELNGTHWLIEWSLLVELVNWKLFFLHDFARVLFPLLYFISDTLVVHKDPCSGGWKNVFDVALPQKLDDLDLDLHETWCHYLTEAILQREHLSECPVAMAWVALNLAFINVAAQDRVQAFDYVHQAQAFLTRVKYLDAYKKDGSRSTRTSSPGAASGSAGPPGANAELGVNVVPAAPPEAGMGAEVDVERATSSASDSSGRVGVSSSEEEQLLLFQNPNAKQQTEEENDAMVATIYERKITFPVDLDLRKFYGMQFPIWELLAKMDFFQGLSIQVQEDEAAARKHLDREMQSLSGLVHDSGVADGRHRWLLENWSQFDVREALGSGHASSGVVGAEPGYDFSSYFDGQDKGSPGLKLMKTVRGKPHVYHRLLMQDLCHVIGFDPNEAYRKSYPNMILFPHFVGDGTRRVFYETQNGLSGSLLEPNVDVVSKYDQLEEAYKVVVQQYVPTVRLDDILRPNGYDVDFLKVDVQGAELLVLQGAAETLESVVVVDVEVHFQPLYVDMPLFADIDRFLRDRGFVFHRISDLTGRGMKPSRLSSSTLWANAVYVKDVDKQL
eukprot:g2003.t1